MHSSLAQNMKRFFFIAWFVILSHSHADVATDPWPKKLQDYTSGQGPVTISGFKIEITRSADQEAGGSGGSMYDFTIENTRTGAKRKFTDQSVGVAILELYQGWPQFEIWSRAGGGSWCRSLERFNGRDYEYVRTDEFTDFDFNAKDKTRTTTMPHGEDLLYYVETRLPEK